jgi:hypothetical protein
MVVILKKELESSAKWRSLILAIMVCGSIVVAGWAAYLEGEDRPEKAASKQQPKPVAALDLSSPSVYRLSDNNGTSPLLQVERIDPEKHRQAISLSTHEPPAEESPVEVERISTAAARPRSRLALPRAEFSWLPYPPMPVPLDPAGASDEPQPIVVQQAAGNPDNTRVMAESLKQRIKLGKVEIRVAADTGHRLAPLSAVVPVVYEESLPAGEAEQKEQPDIFTILGSRLPRFELPKFKFPVPASAELPASRPSSTPRLPWRLPAIGGN